MDKHRPYDMCSEYASYGKIRQVPADALLSAIYITIDADTGKRVGIPKKHFVRRMEGGSEIVSHCKHQTARKMFVCHWLGDEVIRKYVHSR